MNFLLIKDCPQISPLILIEFSELIANLASIPPEITRKP